MLKKSWAATSALLLMILFANGQPKTSPWLNDFLHSQPGTALQTLLRDDMKYCIQVLYLQIDRNSKNQSQFTPNDLHYNPALYFNPASVVKMPLAFLAMEKLNRLNKPGVDHTTPVAFLLLV